MNDLPKNDLPNSTPDTSAFCDSLASYIARRRDDLDDLLYPDDPASLAHKVSHLALRLHRFLGLKRALSFCSLNPQLESAIDETLIEIALQEDALDPSGGTCQ
jgi:hypothetical protein